MPVGSTYTVTKNDFVFVACSGEIEKNIGTFPKKYTFIECTDDKNTLENAIKYRKEARIYGLVREFCPGLNWTITPETEYYIKNGVYIGDDTCPVPNKALQPVEVKKEDTVAQMFSKINDGKNISEELKKTEEVKKETSGFLSSVSSTILSGISNFNDLKTLSLNKLETAATSIGISKRSLNKLINITDKIDARGLIGGDINSTKQMLLGELENTNLYDVAKTPEVLGLLSEQLGISEANLEKMLNTAENVRSLSDITSIEQFMNMDFAFKEKFALDNFIPTDMLDDVMPISLQLLSNDENVRRLAEENAKQLLGRKIMEMVSPNVAELTPGQDLGLPNFLQNFSNMDYRIQKVAAVALGFGTEEAAVLECRNVMDQLKQYRELDEQSNSLKNSLYDHANKLYTDRDLNPKIIDDYLEEHGLKEEELIKALNVSDKLYETTNKTSYSSDSGDWAEDSTDGSIPTQPNASSLETNETGQIPAAIAIPTINERLIIKTETPAGTRFDYNGSLEFKREDLVNGKIPVKFTKVNGNFVCKNVGLTTLENCPEIIGGEFDCSNNELTNLVGGPNEVGWNYRCSNNKLESIKGVAFTIGASRNDSLFNCSNNPLQSLETGRQQEVTIFGRGMLCTDTTLKSFAGTALDIKGTMDVRSNDLRHIDLFANAIVRVGNEIRLDGQKNTERFNLEEVQQRTGAKTVSLNK
jgi:hypothetical protein